MVGPALLVAVAASLCAVAAPALPAGASVSSDHAAISQLEQRIAAQGVVIQELVSRSDQAQAAYDAALSRLAADEARLQQDQRAETAATLRLRRIAVSSYTTGGWASGGGGSILSLFDSSDASKTMERDEYTGLVSGDVQAAISTFQRDQQVVAAEASAASAQKTADAAVLAALDADRRAAQGALAADDAQLAQVTGNLQALLAAIQAQHAAEERAAEQALAAQQAALAASSVPPSPPTLAPAPGVYANPLRAIGALSPERVDQGVDYSGYGPIFALGDGVVLSTVNSGWPGGTFIAYRLTDGPAAGLVVYAAEDIEPMVQVGETVTPSTVIGQMYEGPDGIETGWSDASGDGETMARSYGQFSGANSTAFGYNFSQLLMSLGAPGGILQNDPPTGALPPGWPAW